MKWPIRLILVRHGESQYNAIKTTKDDDPEYQEFKRLYTDGTNRDFVFSERTIELAARLQKKYDYDVSEADTPLTPGGCEQAYQTGLKLAEREELPDCIFFSPYIRTQQTLDNLIRGWPALANIRIIPDERIRERNIGVLEIFNDSRILNVVKPIQGRLFKRQGAYHYRYPQGESIVDVQSRNRQWFQTLTRDCPNKRVLVVTHHLTILSIRSLLERWTPEKFIEIDKSEAPKNCSLTIYRGDPNLGEDGKLILECYNQVLY